MALLLILAAVAAFTIIVYSAPRIKPSRHLREDVDAPANIVHLFEWKWDDIANECEQFLGPNGYKGVQVPPVTENAIVKERNRPWWERYQILSYDNFDTRSGNKASFANMVKRCAAVGVGIYVDVVFNHMAGISTKLIGTGGSTGDLDTLSYPAVPYDASDFHERCPIEDYNDIFQVRNCELVGLPDLDQSKPSVREKIIKYLNSLLELGVAGFRVDAARHIWPVDLDVIYGSLIDLSTKYHPENKRAFIYQEVIEGNNAIKKTEYVHLGVVTEFESSYDLGLTFNGHQKLSSLRRYGKESNNIPSNDAVVFVDNHDKQRHTDKDIINYKSRRLYTMATAFLLAHSYGTPCLMSSFDFATPDQGPPMTANEEIVSPSFDPHTGQCNNGWVCEHRWPEIRQMINFRNVAQDAPVFNWWDNGGDQIAFCRGTRGFIAINNGKTEMNVKLNTCLPRGVYCDVFSGALVNNKCTGKEVEVDEFHQAQIAVSTKLGALAIHIESRIKTK